jgi:GWxTD domain-containing protein
VDLYDRNYGYPEAELKDYVQSLVYIASESERQFLKALKTYPELKNFFVNFWEKRKQNPSQVENITWPEYRERFLYANQQFKAGLRKGWSTDRGRTLMLYGPPTDIQDLSNEQELYPHQIWTYNTLRNQNGVIFVFYDPGMGSNLYQLIHSTLRGEPFNGGWRAQIQKARGPRSPDYLYEGEQRGNPFQFYDDKVLPGVSNGVPR